MWCSAWLKFLLSPVSLPVASFDDSWQIWAVKRFKRFPGWNSLTTYIPNHTLHRIASDNNTPKRSFRVIEYRIAFFHCELEIRFHLCELNRTQRGKYDIYHFTLPTDSYYHIVFFFTLPNANKMWKKNSEKLMVFQSHTIFRCQMINDTEIQCSIQI